MRKPCNSISVASKRIEEENENTAKNYKAASDVVETHREPGYLQTILKDRTASKIK
jgi:hypothetical protein